MARRIRTRIEGAKELDRVLAQLPKKISQRVLTASTRKGANIVRDEGILRLAGDKDDLIVRKVRIPGTSVTIRVGIPRDKFYLMFREFGTRPHTITIGKRRRGSGAVLADPETGAVFGREIQHPGQPPQPFLRPAFDTKKDQALNTIGAELGKQVEKAAVKLAGPLAKSGLRQSRRRRRR